MKSNQTRPKIGDPHAEIAARPLAAANRRGSLVPPRRARKHEARAATHCLYPLSFPSSLILYECLARALARVIYLLVFIWQYKFILRFVVDV